MDPRRLTTLAVSIALAVVIVGSGVAALVVANRGSSAFRSPRGLTVNGSVRPVGVDPDQLAFAWRVTDHRPGARQTGYRIDEHRLEMFGLCPACQAAQPGRSSTTA